MTREQIGLGDVDNTADADKPVSTAVQAAIDQVDQVFSYADYASFPSAGTAEAVYIALNTNTLYYWTGSAYAAVSGGGGSSGREVLTAARTYYVDPVDGNDSNNGLSAGAPFQTIQHAVDAAAALDVNIYDVTIDLWTAAGTGTVTYSVTTPIELKQKLGAGKVIIRGNASDQTSVVITGGAVSNCISATDIDGYILKDLSFYGDAANTKLAMTVVNASLTIDGVSFEDFLYGIYADRGTKITLANTNHTITLAGSFTRPFNFRNSILNGVSTAFNTTGLTAFTHFILGSDLASFDLRASTYTKTSVSGAKYNLAMNSILSLSGVTLPGKSGGTSATGAQVN